MGVPKEEDIRRCGHDYDPEDKVCPECGAAIEEVEVEREYIPSLYDLLEELNDDFFSASEKGTVIVALPNHTHEWVESEDDGNGGWAVKLADTRIPDQCIAALHLKYPKTLEGLQAHESTETLEVTFGVVTFWM